jgi:RNA polymerase sigma-70 factor (ECF subfamily)
VKGRRGHGRAFDLFFDRFGAPLHDYLRRMVGERATAEDLLQETLTRVFRHAARYQERREGEAGFQAWVYRIATNLALTELRRRRYRVGPLDEAAGEAADVHALDPHALLEREEEREALDRAIAALPDEHRAVLLLRVRREMEVRDVARVLGVPEGTVKSRLHHAVRKLRAQMREPGEIIRSQGRAS